MPKKVSLEGGREGGWNIGVSVHWYKKPTANESAKKIKSLKKSGAKRMERGVVGAFHKGNLILNFAMKGGNQLILRMAIKRGSIKKIGSRLVVNLTFSRKSKKEGRGQKGKKQSTHDNRKRKSGK